MSDERLKIAVFIDFDNIEIGVKTTLGGYFDVGSVLEAIKERGEVVSKTAYGDWTRATDYGRSMSQHAIHMVQRNLTPGGDKNGADINLALDALEMAFTHSHINAFVIVGGDSDFITLVEKLKQYDRKVFVVGGRAFTSQVMQKNCTEFVAYEDILGVSTRGRGQAERGGRGAGEANLASAMPLIKRALKLLADREVVPQLGLLKSTLLQLDSSFSERAYGASSFRDFVQKLAKAGYVALKGTDRSFHVELRESGDGAAAAAAPSGEKTERPVRHERHERERQDRHERDRGPAPPTRVDGAEAVPAPEATAATPSDETTTAEPAPAATPEEAAAPEAAAPSGEEPRQGPADGYRIVEAAFTRPGVAPRFPMYIRQVKQFIRQHDESFDERRYGFTGLVDALRYGQREGLFRLDRDRQGVVRVFPGVKLQRPSATDTVVAELTAADMETPEPAPTDADAMRGDAAATPDVPTAAEAASLAPEAVPDAEPGAPGASDRGEEPDARTYDVVTHVDTETGVIDIGRHDAASAPDIAAAPEESATAGRGRRRKTASPAGRAGKAKTAGTKGAGTARTRTAPAAAPQKRARKRQDAPKPE